MGHNLNMSHDFLKVTSITHNYAEKVPRLHPVDDSSCTNINGIMDYYGVSTIHYFEIIILLKGSVKTKIYLHIYIFLFCRIMPTFGQVVQFMILDHCSKPTMLNKNFVFCH